ncbi:hypothetical protein N7493_000943 [Penicillium malachiteum]|uniref:Uncharacterized protein n=1 Tax=Penicillium malachiteum TaxID=1324776 RepID=A0AAD6N1C0_9EURO|nr:hypothetical protein N7493_000943 [Penicillium malachiteum]
MMAAILYSIGGSIVFLTVARSDNTHVGLFIAYYCIWTFTAASGILLSLMLRNVAGQTKKATIIAASFVYWVAGNSAGPHWLVGLVLFIILLSLCTCYIAQNKRKDKFTSDGLAAVDTESAHSYEDMTDKVGDLKFLNL